MRSFSVAARYENRLGVLFLTGFVGPLICTSLRWARSRKLMALQAELQ
jgi:hypothetical protein